MEMLLSSDVILVSFSLLLGGLIGMVWERSRHERREDSSSKDTSPTDKP